VRERLGQPDAARGFILDGFPRTIPQAEALDRMVHGDAIVPIVFVVPEHELVRRLALRRVCEDCGATFAPFGSGLGLNDPGDDVCTRCGGRLVHREDDGADVIRERLRIFARSTEPLVAYYRERPTFASIDGLQPPDAVTADLRAHVERVRHAQRETQAAGRARA
jgi:adenylate kinase